jgi:Fic family protein
MDDSLFKDSKTGKIIWEQKGMFYRFEPNLLPIPFKQTDEMNNLLFEASINLGRLDGIANRFTEKEAELLITPFLFKEATISSEIEGTRSTLSDVYKSEIEKEKDREKALDNQEIKNYIISLRTGLDKIRTQELSEEFIKELHRQLLSGVRGQYKNPGKYKDQQNAIGNDQDTLETAKFVPASPESTPALMTNLTQYLNSANGNPLYKIAIAHYQFETIHPFRDGNGRVGRLLIILFLCKRDILRLPLLYLSEYFKRHKSEYNNKMFEVSSSNRIEEWIVFFLKGVCEQSKKALDFAISLDDYKKELKHRLRTRYKSNNLILIVDMLFENPYIRTSDISSKLKISTPAAGNLVRLLENEKIIEEITGNRRNRIYLAKNILKILDY